MTAISAKYSDDEREAMGAAMAGGMTARSVIEHAAAGTLQLDGVPLEPFTIASESTVRDAKAGYLRRRAGKARSELATAPARDAIETLRRELIGVAESEVNALKRQKTARVTSSGFAKRFAACVRRQQFRGRTTWPRSSGSTRGSTNGTENGRLRLQRCAVRAYRKGAVEPRARTQTHPTEHQERFR